MLERDVQERFVGFVSNEIQIPHEQTNPIRIYKELVHYRFEEVIRNAMPDFCDVLEDERLDALIFEFIQSKPRSPYVWKVPELFMNFLLKENSVRDIAYASDLMWFESIEVELLMGAYEKPVLTGFNWDDDFFLSSSMRMKNLNYRVNQDEFEEVEEHPLIMYYHFDEYAVYFKEITPFMFRFLSYLTEISPAEALKQICLDFSIKEEDEVKELLEGALEELVALSIMVKDISHDNIVGRN